MKYLWYSLIMLVFFACTHPASRQHRPVAEKPAESRFLDSTIQRIYSFKDQRNTAELLPFLQSETALYRQEAAMSMASLQDTQATNALVNALHDFDAVVRQKAAFALGQLHGGEIENDLKIAFRQETELAVQRAILEAIGKTGGETELAYIAEMNYDFSDIQYLNGQAAAIFRLLLNGIVSDAGTQKMLGLLSQNQANSVKLFAATYFARVSTEQTSPYTAEMIAAFNSTDDVFVRMQLAMAIAKADDEAAVGFSSGLLRKTLDYRIIVNTLRGMRAVHYPVVMENAGSLIHHENPNVAVQTASFFLANGQTEDTQKYVELSKKTDNWRANAILLRAALRYSTDKLIYDELIKNRYKLSQSLYERGLLLNALAEDGRNFEFIVRQLKPQSQSVINTYALEAITVLPEAGNFETANQNYEREHGTSIMQKIGEVLQQSVASGDAALVPIAAGMLRNSDYDFKNQISDAGFLSEAIENCSLPEDVEAWLELQKTREFFTGQAAETYQIAPTYREMDWDWLASLPETVNVEVSTTKGSFTIELFVQQAPFTVYNFIELGREGFYNDMVFHRVVANFVVQTGCPRSDGWGSPGYAIRSEFSDLNYEEGMVGMASAGKDTEGSQWFVTHSPTLHLDGRYTIFGRVTKGMEVIHRLEMGDSIKTMKFSGISPAS